MGDEPMEEEDSFYKPVPFSAPYVRPATQLMPVAEKRDSDPDSDDSFDNFPATQSTASASAKSTASSTQSAESKVIPPRIPAFPKTNGTHLVFDPQPSSMPPFTLGPPPSAPKSNVIPVVHPVLKKTAAIVKRSSAATPSSPNSLARHRSANSGLRNGNISTPPVRANIFASHSSPNDTRPATPSGEAKMYRDMLDNERLKMQKMQIEFRKDSNKTAENHRREREQWEAKVKEKDREIEMLKSSQACQKPTSSLTTKTPRIPMRSPAIPILNIPNLPTSSNPEIRKVYPKIANLRRTPHRQQHHPGNALSAFRHPTKDEEDDTFQLDASFEPSATSTPKFTGPIRLGLRRPLILDEALDEMERGAPTPKKKKTRASKTKRVKKSREEMEKMAEKMWKTIEPIQKIHTLFPHEEKNSNQKKKHKMAWVDDHLCQKIDLLDLQKEDDEPAPTAKSKVKMMQQAEQRVQPDITCTICGIDDREVSRSRENQEKEWETKETERVNLMKRGAEEVRARQYSELILSVHRKGIGGLESVSQRKDLVERQFKEKTSRIHRRSLKEAREEKKELWREAMMDELRRNGEMEADLNVLEEGRRDDYLWTSESEDEDWQFPEPFNKDKTTLCMDCSERQRIHRRMTKRKSVRRKLKVACLKDYGVERREQVRNMSVLTKSTMEAAENELNRHVDEVLASSRLVEEQEDEFYICL